MNLRRPLFRVGRYQALPRQTPTADICRSIATMVPLTKSTLWNTMRLSQDHSATALPAVATLAASTAIRVAIRWFWNSTSLPTQVLGPSTRLGTGDLTFNDCLANPARLPIFDSFHPSNGQGSSRNPSKFWPAPNGHGYGCSGFCRSTSI
jgi:hypothetical protein